MHLETPTNNYRHAIVDNCRRPAGEAAIPCSFPTLPPNISPYPKFRPQNAAASTGIRWMSVAYHICMIEKIYESP